MHKTRKKIEKKEGYAVLSSNVGNLGRINIVYSGHPDKKNLYEYEKYKNILKRY